jgi:hypothetical protein
MPIAQIWNIVPDITFESFDKKSKTDAPDQTTLTYKGKIVIRIKHVDEELDSISTKTLTLLRSETTNVWSLSQKDINRLKHLLNQR